MTVLDFTNAINLGYTSLSQQTRIASESWVMDYAFCANCGNSLSLFPNNQPVADFYCASCNEQYELKTKRNTMGRKIIGGAYSTMIERLSSSQNPNFFFLNYEVGSHRVNNFIVIPKHFFTTSLIERRNPLSPKAKRSGWVGCNILINTLPESSKIFYVKDKLPQPKEMILDNWQKIQFLKDEQIDSKGWLVDIMLVIDKIGKKRFSLSDLYGFEDYLKQKYPKNNNIQAKIRQQLQLLRDKDYLKFTTAGNYELK